MSIGTLAYTKFFGLPLVAWGGVTTFTLMAITLLIALLTRWGIRTVPFKYHRLMAYATLALAAGHGMVGLLANLGF